MSIFQSLREMRPFYLLLLAVLTAVVLVQVVAMVMVTRSQVQKAQAHYAAQSVRDSAKASPEVARASPKTSGNEVVQVRYAVVSR